MSRWEFESLYLFLTLENNIKNTYKKLIAFILMATAWFVRGQDTPKAIPMSTRIIGSLMFGFGVLLVTSNVYASLLWTLGFFLPAVPAWFPRDNWSASKPVTLMWYPITVLRSLLWVVPFGLHAASLGATVAPSLVYLYVNWYTLLYALPLAFGWGILQYLFSPNCLNFKGHTVWQEAAFSLLLCVCTFTMLT